MKKPWDNGNYFFQYIPLTSGFFRTFTACWKVMHFRHLRTDKKKKQYIK